MPEHIRRRFVVASNIYYFPGGGRAFVDRGDRLTTRSEKHEVIEGLAAIARTRGWHQITLTGTDRFKQQMWLAAQLAGLAVRDYSPSSHLQGQLARALSRRSREGSQHPLTLETTAAANTAAAPRSQAPPPGRAPTPREWRGRLIDHGPAPYRHDTANSASYVVKLHTARGEEEIWGVDLKRALTASISRVAVGDEVVLRRMGPQEVTRNAAARGERREDPSRPIHRNRFVIETPAFWAARGEFARWVRDPSVSASVASGQHPDLAATYLQLRAAQLAAHRLSQPDDRRRFVALVRGGLADDIARGEPLKSIRVRASTRESSPERSARAAAPLRG